MDKYVNELFTESIISEVTSLYNISHEELYLVGGFENYVYGFTKEGKSYVVRISHSSHRLLEEIEAEIDFLYFLANNGASVSMPIKTIKESLVEKIASKDGSYFTVCAFTKAEGEVPSRKTATPEMFYNYGKTIGNFHKLTKYYQESPNITKRFNWDQDSLIINASDYLPLDDKLILYRLDQIVDNIKLIDKNKDNFGLIHSDIHMGNFFIKDNQLTVFDFDDSCYFYYASDLAIALFYLVFMLEEEEQIKLADNFMEHFMKGYLSENIISLEDYLTIPIFLKLREVILYVVLYKTVDVKENRFAKAYLEKYRNRIIKNTAFINLDWMKYYLIES
jgi:Ser/Thr protein kinase RdoA (MazF antagonist)